MFFELHKTLENNVDVICFVQHKISEHFNSLRLLKSRNNNVKSFPRTFGLPCATVMNLQSFAELSVNDYYYEYLLLSNF